jgi:hypothetical protein
MAFIVVFGAARGGATVVLHHDVDEMTTRSELVLHARVAEQRAVVENGRVITLTEIEVIDVLKGKIAPGSIQTIYQFGGIHESGHQVVVGQHKFQFGEEMVLFAMNHANARITAYGIGLGKYRVVRDASGVRVIEELGDVMAATHGKDGKMVIGKPSPHASKTLDEFKAEIRTYVQHPIPLDNRQKGLRALTNKNDLPAVTPQESLRNQLKKPVRGEGEE